jgi:hypothetical protein
MLDRATVDRLSRTPEKNAPMLNVALAEEGTAAVLLSLARSPAVGPEALAVIADRLAREGAEVGHDPEAQAEEQVSAAADLDRLLVAHPRASDDVRDAVLARHTGDAFFVLAAASHPHATPTAALLAASFPAASPAHDRLWLALVDPASVPPLTLEEWSQDQSPLRREAAARIAREPGLLAALARDPARQVRRAVASNRFAAEERARLAASDPAPDVRARAAGPLTVHGDVGEGASLVDTARFAAALRAMATGGVLAPDVVRALSGAAGDLDDEGALLAGQVLPRRELGALIDHVVDHGLASTRGESLAAGLALRPLLPWGVADEGGADDEAEHTEVVYDAVKSLSRTTTAESRLTGKARLAAWAAEGLARCAHVDRARVVADLGRRPIAGERMILARGAAIRPAMIAELCDAALREAPAGAVPGALLELAWADPRIPDAQLADLAARLARPKKRSEDLPEDEVDLDPAARPLPVLEKVVLATAVRAHVSPRAALAAVALDARRVRYVLSAMPQWKGRISGGRLARVLRQHAGAITVAQAEARARASRVESWTERLLSELELSIALALGHLTGAEVVRRISIGRQSIDDGINLASGAEARAALEGAASVQPILEWATKHRTAHGPALAVWLLLERLDRQRGPTLIAASIDSLAAGAERGKGVVPPSVCDALALAEQRRPGRLESIHPQSPRGRATLASAIARAYRALGGMRDERQG